MIYPSDPFKVEFYSIKFCLLINFVNYDTDKLRGAKIKFFIL